MSSKGETPVNRFRVWIVCILGLCVCSLMAREFFAVDVLLNSNETLHILAEHGGIHDHNHLHEDDHDHDWVAASQLNPASSAGQPFGMSASHLPAGPAALHPILPPPKAA